jgi:hypothetical protein
MDISSMKEALEFEGWVEHKFDRGNYDQKITVANYDGDDQKNALASGQVKGKHPMCYEFKANVKSGVADLLDDIEVGDKVHVKFYAVGRSGISKSKGTYYCITEFALAKKDGIVVIARKPRTEETAEDNSNEEIVADDIPF